MSAPRGPERTRQADPAQGPSICKLMLLKRGRLASPACLDNAFAWHLTMRGSQKEKLIKQKKFPREVVRHSGPITQREVSKRGFRTRRTPATRTTSNVLPPASRCNRSRRQRQARHPRVASGSPTSPGMASPRRDNGPHKASQMGRIRE